ncbi:MAG TPA: ABC transporter permease, partial [Anaerolineae bacterium]|nr:ABC transporter permease [Anaerolineae bacterium]
MMNALRIAWKDIQILRKDRGQLLMLFLLPMVIVLVFSAAFAAGQDGNEVIVVPVVNLDAGGVMSQTLLDNLNQDRGIQTQDYDQAKVEADLQDETIKLALHI